MLRLNELVDQAGGSRESNPFLLLTRRHTQCGCQVRLARPTFPDQDNRFGPLDLAPIGQLSYACGRNQWLREIEIVDCLHPWQAGVLNSAGMCMPLPLF